MEKHHPFSFVSSNDVVAAIGGDGGTRPPKAVSGALAERYVISFPFFPEQKGNKHRRWNKKEHFLQVFFSFRVTAPLPLLVETEGLEPPTSCMWSKRSNRLSYASENFLPFSISIYKYITFLFINQRFLRGCPKKFICRKSFILHKPRISRIIATFFSQQPPQIFKKSSKKTPDFSCYFCCTFFKDFSLCR